MGKIPEVGEHTDRILTELGIDANTIAAWRRAGIV
jgi:crotonobetainyl-CoA:carnitine CoA-transferase CaiB-like acyl-CoA transferase